jgi:hypothetical protein
MTLLIAGVTQPYAVVLADRRVSGAGRPDDEYNKMTALFAADGKGVFAFTGLASFLRLDTAQVIVDALVGRADPEREVGLMVDRLTDVLGEELAKVRLPVSQKRLSVLFAGYTYRDDGPDTDTMTVEATLCRLSNFQRGRVTYPVASAHFWKDDAVVRRPETGAPFLFAVAGTTGGLVPQEISRIEDLIHEQRPPEAVVSKAIEVGRVAAKSTKSRGYVGESWSSAIVYSQAGRSTWVEYYSPVLTTQQFSVNLVDASSGEQPVVAISNLVAETDRPISVGFPGTPRNAPCPCGSGGKYKRCHGHTGLAAKGGWFLNRLSEPGA